MKLATFDNSWYKPGSFLRRGLWYITNYIFFNCSWFPFSKVKVIILRLFGAEVGRNVLLKPEVNIKYPWNLKVGNNVWIGESVWLDSLGKIIIGDDVCISQGAFLLTGNHNYKRPSFDFLIEDIILEYGVWIGAKSIVCPGVTCFNGAVLAVGSVASKDLKSFSIYQGNPAKIIRKRIYQDEG
mgnify:FL=1